jgi:hypothetical protein
MVNIRMKRVAMTKQLKREVFMACIVRVSRGILPVGSFKAVADHFEIDPKTVGKLWKSTMIQVNGYQPNLPIDPPFILANLPTTTVEQLYHGNENAVKLYTQPAQSPDLNVYDLGFFASLQSMYYKTAPTDSLDLIDTS